MPHSSLKKHFQSLTKEQMIELVLDMYEHSKPVREYLDYYLNPNEKELMEKYRAIILKEFALEWKTKEPQLRFSVAKKAISEFKSFKPDPKYVADLMLSLPEAACEFTYTFGDMSEQFYDSAYNNFKAAVTYIEKNGLLEMFKPRCKNCVEWASDCGYGFEDDMADLYYEYYGE